MAYTRFVNVQTGESTVRLVFSRAHVVPIDMAKRAVKDQEDHLNSVPRLELTAARLAAVVRDMVTREANIEFSRFVMWTDSERIDDSTDENFIRLGSPGGQ